MILSPLLRRFPPCSAVPPLLGGCAAPGPGAEMAKVVGARSSFAGGSPVRELQVDQDLIPGSYLQATVAFPVPAGGRNGPTSRGEAVAGGAAVGLTLEEG